MPSLLLMNRLHLTPSCASSPDNYPSDKSFMMLSNHLRFGLRLLLFHRHHPLSCTHVFLLFSIINMPGLHFDILSCSVLDIFRTFVVSIIPSMCHNIMVYGLYVRLFHFYFRSSGVNLVTFIIGRGRYFKS